MTNFEKWNKEIGELKGNLAVVKGMPCDCDSITCDDCEFDANDCVLDAWDWLWKEYKEYEEPNPKRIIDVDKFVAYLESEIREFETAENYSADNGDYARALDHHGHASAFHELLGLITLDNPPEWVKIEGE